MRGLVFASKTLSGPSANGAKTLFGPSANGAKSLLGPSANEVPGSGN